MPYTSNQLKEWVANMPSKCLLSGINCLRKSLTNAESQATCPHVQWRVPSLWNRRRNKCAFVVVQSLSCVRLCDPMDCSTSGFPILHYLPQFPQTHVHWVSDAIQPSPPAFDLSQHQGLLKWVSSSHHVAKVLEFQLHHQSFQWISGLISFRMDWLDLLAGIWF